MVNAAEIAREAGIDRKTVEGYFQIIEDLLIGGRIPPFTKRAKRRLVTGDKFFFFDTGIYRTLRPVGPLDTPEEIDGAAFKTLLLQEITALNDYFGLGLAVYYWRTSSNIEVDFVIYGRNTFIAVEVKRSRYVKKDMMSGLKLFKADYPQAKCFLACGVGGKEYRNGIEVWPFEDFIINLPVILGIR